MIHLLYDILLLLLLPLIVPIHLYRARKRGRPAALAERFGFISPEPAGTSGGGTIWVHAVSVGETIAVKPLLKALKTTWPHRGIVLSNGTETGRAIASTLKEVDRCIYFPFDYPWAADRLLTAIDPALVIVVETEIWPAFLRRARRRGIPVMLANGRISDRSFGGYQRFAWFFRRVLPDFSAFCMQSAEDGRRIAAIGAPADRVHAAGNLKYDIPAVTVTPQRQREMRERYGIAADVPVLVAGSTHKGEDEPVIAAYRRLLAGGRELFLVLVPRHPERAPEVAALLGRANLPYRRRSGLDDSPAPGASGGVLLVDTVGELMACYAAADLVFVGGSLVPTGGHNILEPASLGRPVLFGPHMSNFREIAALVLAAEAGRQVADGDGLAAACGELLDDGELCRAMGDRGRRIVAENSGAVERHLQVAAELLDAGAAAGHP
jgi:3-deoxy-D-manno-octulosonic-acid transferase